MEYVVLFLTIFITIIFYISIITRGGLAVGIDAPYYMIQVREILRSGFMKYGDPPLVFYILTVFALLSGSIETGFTVSVPLLAVLAGVPSYYLVKEVTGQRLPAFLTLLLILYYPSYIRMLGDFVKNQFGIVFIGFTLLYLFKRDLGRGRYIYITLSTVLAGLTHILDFGLTLLVLGAYLIHDILTTRDEVLQLLLCILIPSLVYLVGFFLLPFYFGDLGKGAGFVSDVVEVGGETILPMGLNIYLPAFASALVAGGLFIALYKDRRVRESRLPFILLILQIFLITPWRPEWLFRIMLMSFIPISLITGYLIHYIEKLLPQFLIAVLILSYPISAAVPLSARLHPTITPSQYHELYTIKDIIGDKPAEIIYVGHPGEKYWAEYILDKPILRPGSKPSDPTTPLYLIIPTGMKPPPTAKPIYRGEEYNLYRL
jgi:hypothetical protein